MKLGANFVVSWGDEGQGDEEYAECCLDLSVALSHHGKLDASKVMITNCQPLDVDSSYIKQERVEFSIFNKYYTLEAEQGTLTKKGIETLQKCFDTTPLLTLGKNQMSPHHPYSDLLDVNRLEYFNTSKAPRLFNLSFVKNVHHDDSTGRTTVFACDDCCKANPVIEGYITDYDENPYQLKFEAKCSIGSCLGRTCSTHRLLLPTETFDQWQSDVMVCGSTEWRWRGDRQTLIAEYYNGLEWIKDDTPPAAMMLALHRLKPHNLINRPPMTGYIESLSAPEMIEQVKNAQIMFNRLKDFDTECRENLAQELAQIRKAVATISLSERNHIPVSLFTSVFESYFVTLAN